MGTPFNFTVTEESSTGSVNTGYTGTVSFTSTDPSFSPIPNYTFTPTDAGVHVFSGTMNTIGSQTITATDTVSTSLSNTSGPIEVNAVERTLSSAPRRSRLSTARSRSR